MDYRKELGFKDDFLGIGLTSRKNLCVHESVSKEKNGVLTDAKCRNLTAPWVRQKGGAELCQYFEALENGDPAIPKGVFTLEEFKSHGKNETLCPYFFARKLLPFANVIIYSYHYLLDPKVAEQVSKELSKESIVVFDEAHNIDNVCTESLSIDISRPNLDGSIRSLNDLSSKIQELKEQNSDKLKNEYSKLVEGLQKAQQARMNAELLSNPGNFINSFAE